MSDARKGDTTYSYWDSDQLQNSTLIRGEGISDNLVSSYSYDEIGRLDARDLPDTVNPAGGSFTNITSWSYDHRGNVERESGQQTYRRDYTYDSQSRLARMETHRNFQQAAVGPIVLNTPTDFSATYWNYHATRGWLSSKRYDDGNGVSGGVGGQGLGPDYSYTNGGRLKTRQWARKPNGSDRILTTYNYDFEDSAAGAARAGDLIGVQYDHDGGFTPNLAFSYTRWGGYQSVTDITGTRQYAYRESETSADNDLRLKSEVFGSATGSALYGVIPKTLTRSYDALGRPAQISLGTTAVSYTHLTLPTILLV